MIPGNSYGEHECHQVTDLLSKVGSKWTVKVITLLSDGPMRFSEIKRRSGGISQKMLTATLRDLEMDGFVTRTVTPSIPPRVDYELTALGRDLQGPVHLLGKWAVENSASMREARQRYLSDND
ncbi:helix-turn-helix domain-containing protein [Devosia sp. SD17-2]|jgi:DNA-binding HxlR family transcriptional regulator|uniref:winged helix-turn-helix transcriptional regulator n=1 Tax=Devosia sp. SD17-2 TaxID=2976459 RepID=UPI0023D7CDEB|nr:helix-turn-helix domain-containing protein [Devosia sp. SD17-2]WEJ34813.1 helix-turn-helix transcriptional regulator [Devosia sp. SD17-2]